MAPNINFIPITLTPLPPPVGLTTANFTELLAAVCKYTQGVIQENVLFVQSFNNPPGFNAGSLIYVINRRNFFAWNTGTGQYDIVTQFQVGDIKQSAISGDDILNGWIQLNGRLISSITGLSATQTTNLMALYPGGTLPNLAPLMPSLIQGFYTQFEIPGAFTSGAFTDSETVTQTGSGASAGKIGAQSTGTQLDVVNVTGRPTTTGVWTGGSSGATFTPTAVPGVFYGLNPSVSKVYAGSYSGSI